MSELYEIHGQLPAKGIIVDDRRNRVTFDIQEGSIKEVGENGCQIDEMVRFARKTIEHFQDKFPCPENVQALTKLDEALHWLARRLRDRTERGVEGKNKP